ncbi:MAG: FG-GAP-like repeat-containing protein [bacterium]|nr:FG-GAP-like repeat-containing protein [bacterium]
MIYRFILIMLLPLLLYSESEQWEKFNYVFSTNKNRFSAVEACDIDVDGDMDLFAGYWNGCLAYFENIGTPKKFFFKLVNPGLNKSTSYNMISAGNKAVPRFVDIDADGDMDLFIGNNDGNIAFYRNDGDIRRPNFKLIRDGSDPANSYFNINAGLAASPFFADIDNDADYDLFIGNALGFLAFYKNDGTATSPLFTRIKGGLSKEDSFNNISTEKYSVPFFRDIRNIGKDDLFIGNWDGAVYFFENKGTLEMPGYDLLSKNFGFIHASGDSTPCLVDLNNDGIDEIICGNSRGGIDLFKLKGKGKLTAFHIGDAPAGNAPDKGSAKKNQDPLQPIKEADIIKKYQEQIWKTYYNGDYIETLNLIELKLKRKDEKTEELRKKCSEEVQRLLQKEMSDSFLLKEVSRDFKNAVDFYISGQYEKSMDAFTLVLNTAPNNKVSTTYKKKANDKILEQKNNEKADQAYNEALEEYKNNNLDHSLLLVKQAMELSPTNPEYQLNFVNISNMRYAKLNTLFYQTNTFRAGELIKKEKYDEALDILYAVKSRFPEDQDVNKNISLCESKMTTMLNLNKTKLLKMYLQKADEAFNSEKFDQAVRNYGLALKYSPDSAEIKEKMKLAQEKLKKSSETVIDPQVIKAHFQKGLEYYSLNQYENAVNEWNKVLELDPENKIAQKNIEKAKMLLKK